MSSSNAFQRRWGHLIVMILLSLLCFSEVRAQTTEKERPEPPSIRSRLAQVKMQLLELTRRSGLPMNLLLPRPAGLVIILTQSDLSPEVLRSVSLRVRETELILHHYTPIESAALRRGGTHRVMALDRLDSDLPLTATVTVLDARKETRQLETGLLVRRDGLPMVIELKVTALPGQDPELKAQVILQPSATRMEEIFTQNIHYLLDTGDHLQAAVSLLTVLEQDRKDSDLQEERKLLLGTTYVEWEVDSEAARLLHAITAKPGPAVRSAIAWFYLEKLYYRQGAYDKALEAYSKAQGNLPRALLAEAQYLAGNSLLYQRSYLKAVEYLSLIPEDSEWYPFAIYSSGLAHLNAQEVSSTLNQFRKLMELDPGGDLSLEALIDRARITLGFFLADQGRYEKSLEIFNTVPPGSLYADQAQFGVGWTYLKRGECEKAVVIFEDLTTRWPDSAYGQEARLKVGTCYSDLKAYRKAVESYQEALRAYSVRHEKLRTLQDDLFKTPPGDWLKTQGLHLSDSSSGGPGSSRPISTVPAQTMTGSQEGSKWVNPLIKELSGRAVIQQAIAALDDIEQVATLLNRKGQKTGDPSALAPHQLLLEQIRQQGHGVVKEVLTEQIKDLRRHVEEMARQADIGLLKNFNLVNQR